MLVFCGAPLESAIGVPMRCHGLSWNPPGLPKASARLVSDRSVCKMELSGMAFLKVTV